MLKFTELFSPDTIRHGMIVASKKRLLETVATIAAEKVAPAEQCLEVQQGCFDYLINREKLGNSCLGSGVAMPKARLPEDCQPVGVFIHLDAPVDYESADKREVDLVFAIFIPEQMCVQFIPDLPEFGERMIDKAFTKQLRAAQSAEEIWQIFEFFDQTACAENEEEVSAQDDSHIEQQIEQTDGANQ